MRIADCGSRNGGSKRLLNASAVLVVLLVPAHAAEEAAKEYRTETLRGRVVFLAEALEKQAGIRMVPEARERILALQTADGTLMPLLEDARGRAFRRDERLREMNVELVVRRYEKNPLAQIIRVMEVTKDGRYEIDYWCDICAIATVEKKDCECCQGPVELRRRKVDQ
jgi:hypothetical protein